MTRVQSRYRLRTLLPGSLLVLTPMLLVGCTDDEDPVGPDPPETSTAQVEAYLQTLPGWSTFAAPVPDNEVANPDPSYFEQEGGYLCSVREASITRNPEEIVTFSPDSEILWLGALIQGRSHRDGLGSLMELPIRQRAPLPVSIDLLFSDNTRTVVNPHLASVSQAIGQLIDAADAADHKSGSSIYFNQVQSHSLEQSTLKLGLSVNYLGVSVKSALQAGRTAETTTLTASFTQKMFTTSVVLPQSPMDFFNADLTMEAMQEQIDRGNIGPENLPVYVGSMTWGRMLLVTMTSTAEVSEMKAALHASAAFGDVSANTTHKAVLDSAEFRVVAIGGHAQAAIDLIRTGELGSYFEDDARLTTARPISYVLRNLTDNSIAKVSETTEYAIRECNEGNVQRFDGLSEWQDAVDNWERESGGETLTLTRVNFETTPEHILMADEIDDATVLPPTNFPMGHEVHFLGEATGYPFDFLIKNRNANEIPNDDRQWGLVYRDNELGRGANDRWISVGDTDGADGRFRAILEDDDLEIRILDRDGGGGAPVYAVMFELVDNSNRGGESLIVRGEGYEIVFEGTPAAGFIGFLAPFPITSVIFDEDAGGDDIAVRDFRFGYVN